MEDGRLLARVQLGVAGDQQIQVHCHVLDHNVQVEVERVESGVHVAAAAGNIYGEYLSEARERVGHVADLLLDEANEEVEVGAHAGRRHGRRVLLVVDVEHLRQATRDRRFGKGQVEQMKLAEELDGQAAGRC